MMSNNNVRDAFLRKYILGRIIVPGNMEVLHFVIYMNGTSKSHPIIIVSN